MITYTYEHFLNDLELLTRQCQSFKADTILAIARGGVTLGHALAMSLNIRNLQSIRAESYDGMKQREGVSILGSCDLSASKRVLIVDDIVDSGKTLHALLGELQAKHPEIVFKTATLFTKQTALVQPDFSLHEATDWIDFFWERDYLQHLKNLKH
ncbi:MAG: phosphoribosyltransferase [Sulfuricurvum sp.]|nr:phosphoribosyltransferase [Sulfuricurvum sp.]